MGEPTPQLKLWRGDYHTWLAVELQDLLHDVRLCSSVNSGWTANANASRAAVLASEKSPV